MKIFMILTLGLSVNVFAHGLDTSMYNNIQPVNIQTSPMDMAIKAQQVRYLQNQNRQMEIDQAANRSNSLSEQPVAKDQSPDTESAKITVTFPNNEEKVFRFSKQSGPQQLDLGSKWSKCVVGFDTTARGLDFVELSCSPTNSGSQTKDRARIYSTRAGCGPSSSSLLIINDYNQKQLEQKQSTYSVLIECAT